jgi:hypothetical protein
MYHKEIEGKASTAIHTKKHRMEKETFLDRAEFSPKDFTPLDDESDATFTARDIIAKRTNDEIKTIAQAVSWMLIIGEGLSHKLAIKQLKNTERRSVSLTEGRSLYLLLEYFDLTTVGVIKLQWCEVFAVLVLLQSATIKALVEESYGSDDLSQAIKLSAEHTVTIYRIEIFDSVARAECLFDKKSELSLLSKSGGEGKAKNTQPLKDEVIKRYLKSFMHLNNKKAGEEIERELIAEQNQLLLQSYSESKALQFSKWISLFRNKDLKISVGF